MRKLGASIAAFTLAMANWVDCTPAILRAADPPAILPYVLSGDHYPYYLLADPQGIPTATRTDQARSMFDWSNGCGYRGHCPAPAVTTDLNADYEGCPEGDDSAVSSDEDITAQTEQENSFSDESEYNADWSPEYASPSASDVASEESYDDESYDDESYDEESYADESYGENDWSSDEESLYGEDAIDGESDAQDLADYEEDSEQTDGVTNADTDVPPPVADASIYEEDFYGDVDTAESAPATESAADSDFYGDEYGDYEYAAPEAPAVTEAADVDADYDGYGDYDGSEYYGSEYDAAAELAPIDETSPTADVEAAEDANLASVVDAWPTLPSPIKSVIMAMVKLTGDVRVAKAPSSAH